MNIDSFKLPPVSDKFYNILIQTFPPLSPLDITHDTNMIDVHRNAAQQEVLAFIHKAVRTTEQDEATPSLLNRIINRFKR